MIVIIYFLLCEWYKLGSKYILSGGGDNGKNKKKDYL